MNISNVKSMADGLFAEASFLSQINNDNDYEQALALMDELIEDYDQYVSLIDLLSISIERWEAEAEEFAEFNSRIENLADDVAMLKVLMDQYNLKADDLKDEIGSKSLVSMILNGSRQLTKDHIQALSNRFNVSPSLFFNQ